MRISIAERRMNELYVVLIRCRQYELLLNYENLVDRIDHTLNMIRLLLVKLQIARHHIFKIYDASVVFREEIGDV